MLNGSANVGFYTFGVLTGLILNGLKSRVTWEELTYWGSDSAAVPLHQ